MSEKVKVFITKNKYKGDGKAWIAEVDEDGKIQSFLQGTYECTNGTGRGCYEWAITYELPDGRYLAHTSYTKSHSVRQYFRVLGGKVIWEKWYYPRSRDREMYEGKCPGDISVEG